MTQKKLVLSALFASLLPISSFAQTETTTTTEKTRTSERLRVAHPDMGVLVGPTVGTNDAIEGWGPQVAVFASGVIYEGLHLGPELGYAIQDYRRT